MSNVLSKIPAPVRKMVVSVLKKELSKNEIDTVMLTLSDGENSVDGFAGEFFKGNPLYALKAEIEKQKATIARQQEEIRALRVELTNLISESAK